MIRHLRLPYDQPPECIVCREKDSEPQLTVFCDLDGPIVDVSDRYYSTYDLALEETREFYAQQGITIPVQVLSKETFWEMKQNRIPDLEIAKSSGLVGHQIEEFRRRVVEIVNQPEMLHLDRIQAGVQWALALLHSRQVRLILVTLRPQTEATQILQNYGLARLFTCICGTQITDAAYYNYTALKTALLKELVRELDTSLHKAWMIGDTEADILAGQAVGIPTIGLTCGIRSRTQLEKLQPTRIHEDLISTSHYLLFKEFYGMNNEVLSRNIACS